MLQIKYDQNELGFPITKINYSRSILVYLKTDIFEKEYFQQLGNECVYIYIRIST